MSIVTTADEQSPPIATVPANLSLSACGFEDREYAISVLVKLHACIKFISETIDISNLDGVTVAFDYENALASLDRGIVSSYTLTPTKDVVLGVAMTPSVLRDGKVKSHIFLNANFILGIMDEISGETDAFGEALHIIAHECAHVEVTSNFDKCFPQFILQKRHEEFLDNLRWQAIMTCWDEYAACRLTGVFAHNPTKMYLDVFVKILSETRAYCFKRISDYRVHKNVDEVVTLVFEKIIALMKYASYFLGASMAQDNPETYPSMLIEEPEFSWFEPFYYSLIDAQQSLWDQAGRWNDQKLFDRLGDVLESVATSIGIDACRNPVGVFWAPLKIA